MDPPTGGRRGQQARPWWSHPLGAAGVALVTGDLGHQGTAVVLVVATRRADARDPRSW